MPPHLRRQPVGVLLELPAQPRLAHPGRPGHQHQPRHPPVRRRVEQVLDRAQLRVPAGQRRLQPVHPLRPAHRRTAPGSPATAAPAPALPFSACSPASANPTALPASRCVAASDQHRARLGRRLHPGRGIHRIPGHHPLTDRAQGHRHLAGHHPRPRRQPRHPRLRSQLGHRGHQVQRGPHRPLRVPLGRRRGAPHRHHRVPDELLHHPAVPADHRPRHREILRQQLPDRLGIPRLRQRGEPHHIAEQHRAHPPLRHRRPARPGAAAGDAARPRRTPGPTPASACPQARQNRCPAMTGSPHDGHPPSGAPQSPQNRSPSPRDAPHRGHVTMRHLYPGQTHPATPQHPDIDLPASRSPAPNQRMCVRLSAQPTRLSIRPESAVWSIFPR